MKKGYIRLLVFEFFIFIILFLNSFVWNILSKHIMNIFLFIIIIMFKILFGLEKDRHRYVKDIIMDIFIFLLVFFIAYYLFGIIISFARGGDYYNFNGFKDFIFPTFCYVLFREFLRYHFMCKADLNKITMILSVIMFIWLDVSTSVYYSDFSSHYSIFTFFALVLLPAISNNIVFSYITLRVGYKPVMFYALVMRLYYYIFPIIPNPNEYLASVINFVLPLLLFYRIYHFLKKERDEVVDRNYSKYPFLGLIGSSFFVIVLVYFTSGYFSYWAIAVASGSMSPSIRKGDVAIIQKVDDHYGVIKKGDVLAFKYDNVTIVHRVINKVYDNNKYYFYTKGDANNNEDNFAIEENMIIGVVKIKIPFVGIPTVWVNEL